MSSYTGLYVQRLESGEIHGVQVVDPGGNSISLDPKTYVERQVLPAIETLPDISEYNAATAKQKVSPVILALADWAKGQALSDEAIQRMRQYGFVHPDDSGQLRITPSGEFTLRENGLL